MSVKNISWSKYFCPFEISNAKCFTFLHHFARQFGIFQNWVIVQMKKFLPRFPYSRWNSGSQPFFFILLGKPYKTMVKSFKSVHTQSITYCFLYWFFLHLTAKYQPVEKQYFYLVFYKSCTFPNFIFIFTRITSPCWFRCIFDVIIQKNHMLRTTV